MKKLYTIFLALVLTSGLSAQAPQRISYQAVIRNNSDVLVVNHAVGLQISILKDATPVYIETQISVTNSNGLVSIEIGAGTIVTGTLAGINWSDGTYYIMTETDPAGGTNYTISGSSQILSVPFALYAETAENINGAITETQSLTLNSNQLSISGAGGNAVTFTNWDNDKTDDVTFTAPVSGDILYFNGTVWTAVPKGITGQVLTLNSSGVPEWQSTFNSPTATTESATFSLPAAILNGVVNPNKLSTTVTFEYGETVFYGNTATAIQSPVNASSNTNVNCSVSGLVAGTTYHFRVKAENVFGITYGDDMTFTLLGNGITWEGGLIFYLDASGMHGLTAASVNQASSDWGCYPSVISGADGTTVGKGNQNTLDIVAGCATIGIAAEICSSLTLNGYDDWFLPSKDELGLMYTNLYLQGKGSFGTTLFYWSSSEYNINYSYRLNFSGGVSGTSLKNATQYVRAVRAF